MIIAHVGTLCSSIRKRTRDSFLFPPLHYRNLSFHLRTKLFFFQHHLKGRPFLSRGPTMGGPESVYPQPPSTTQRRDPHVYGVTPPWHTTHGTPARHAPTHVPCSVFITIQPFLFLRYGRQSARGDLWRMSPNSCSIKKKIWGIYFDRVSTGMSLTAASWMSWGRQKKDMVESHFRSYRWKWRKIFMAHSESIQAKMWLSKWFKENTTSGITE